MPEYIVTRKTDGAEIYRYNADAPIEWSGMEFADHDHVEAAPVVTEPAPQADPTRWRIYVGSFFDRFGAALNLNDKQINAVYKRLNNWLPSAIQLIDVSFLNHDFKSSYKALITQRVSQLMVSP